MRKGKKIISFALTAALAIGTLAGCGSGKGDEGSGEKVDTGRENTKGRYLEEDVALPENTDRIYDLVQLEDGTMRIATSDTDGREAVWDLKEDGASWEKVYDMPQEWRCSDSFYMGNVTLSPKGDAIALTSGMLEADSEDSEQHYYHLDASGAINEIPDLSEEYTYFMDYTRDGVPLILRQNCPVSALNTDTGELTELDSGSDIAFFSVAGNTVYTVTYDGEVLSYDPKTGDPLPKDENLADSVTQSGMSLSLTNLETMPLIFCEDKTEENLFYCGSAGLYRHVKNGTVSEMLINGELTSLGSPDVGVKAMEQAEDESFYIVGKDSAGYKLMHYTYSKDVSTVPDTEIRVYALYDNSEIRQNITQYQKANPDVFVNLEVGITEDNGITASDALKTLGTEIMAGNGPDLLVLDGMPVDSYIEKGLLEDVSDLVESSEGLFDNLISAMKQDGKLYCVPLRIGLPLVEAETSYLDKIQDLTTLADVAEEMKASDSEMLVLSKYTNGAMLAAQLYDACSPAWVKEDGTVDQKKLEEFYTQIARIFDRDEYDEINMNLMGMGDISLHDYQSSIGGGVLELYCDKIMLNMGNITNLATLSMLYTVNQDKEGYGFKYLNGQAENAFLPKIMVGINSKSEQKEEAGGFLQFLLTKEAQKADQATGLPVQEQAFDELCDAWSDDGSIGVGDANDPDSFLQMDMKKPDQAAIDQLKEYICQADTPAISNEIIREAVLKQADDCVLEKITPEKAAKEVVNQVNLYLAE